MCERVGLMGKLANKRTGRSERKEQRQATQHPNGTKRKEMQRNETNSASRSLVGGA